MRPLDAPEVHLASTRVRIAGLGGLLKLAEQSFLGFCLLVRIEYYPENIVSAR